MGGDQFKVAQRLKPGLSGIDSTMVDVLRAGSAAIKATYEQLGGEAKLGKPLDKNLGQMWRFADSAIVFDDDTGKAFFLFGAIYQKWLHLGGLSFGTPCTETLVAPDGVGRYVDFLSGGAAIYWAPGVGANMVYGAIKERWMSLGGPSSYLGYPTSDQVPFPDNGAANDFQHGGIYHWPDTGPIDLRDVVVHYTGMWCFAETDIDQSDWFTGSADEPYVIFGLTTGKDVLVRRSKVEGDVDAGEQRPDLLELYRGRPYGLNIAITVMEHDLSDPNKYLPHIERALMTAHTAGTAAFGLIPIVGIPIAAAVGPVLGALMPDLAEAINSGFDFGDDTIGTGNVMLSARDMVLLAARTENSTAGPIGFKVQSPLISGEGAAYKVFLGVVPA